MFFPATAAAGIAFVVFALLALCVLIARCRHRKFREQQGFRYSQV